MTMLRAHPILCSLLLAAALGVSSSASAQKAPAPLSQTLRGDAKVDYEAGKVLLADADFASALVKFDAAYAKAHDPRLLWNMAVCEKNLRHYSKVIRLLKRYKEEGATILSAKDVQEAEDLVYALQSLVATLKLTVNEPGASVFVDDELVGKSPLDKPVVVDIGARKVRVEKEGFKSFSQTVTVGGAPESPLDVKLEKLSHEGHLAVVAKPGDAISIDGKQVGTGRWEGALPSGGHSLHVEAKGMRSYDAEVSLQDKETRTLTVTLEGEKKGLPTWLYITAGSVAVAGLAVGGFFLFRPEAEQPSGPSGTFDPGQAIAGWRH